MIVGFLGWIFLLWTLFTPKFNSENQQSDPLIFFFWTLPLAAHTLKLHHSCEHYLLINYKDGHKHVHDKFFNVKISIILGLSSQSERYKSIYWWWITCKWICWWAIWFKLEKEKKVWRNFRIIINAQTCNAQTFLIIKWKNVIITVLVLLKCLKCNLNVLNCVNVTVYVE